MSELPEKYPWLTDTRFIGPAHVLEVDESGSVIIVQLNKDFESPEVEAQKAIPGQLYPGDRVLVLSEDSDHTYIIGILEQKTVAGAEVDRLALDGGTYAVRDRDSVKVFSRKRELLFEYDEKECKTRINLDSGDLEFVTRNGNINFVAGRDILLNGHAVGITSRNGIVMGIMDKLGKLKSAFTIKENDLHLQSQLVSVEAEKGDLHINESAIRGKRISVQMDSASLTINRLETTAQTIISKAKNMYHMIEQLSQLKTGRMRTIVENTFHFKSKKAMLKSDEDFKIRAEKIHLG